MNHGYIVEGKIYAKITLYWNKEIFWQFWQFTQFIHANFVKIRDRNQGDAKKVFSFICSISVVYTRKFCQDPWSETRRCKKSFFLYLSNIRSLYTQILSRSVIWNKEMQKKFFLLFVQYPWFMHANFVKIRDQ